MKSPVNKYGICVVLALIALAVWLVVASKPSGVRGFSNDTTTAFPLTPTIATSTGIGTPTGSATIVGTGNAFVITVATGPAPVANGTVGTTTLAFACPTAVVPVFSPANFAAANLGTTTKHIFMTSASTTAFSIKAGTTGLDAGATYIWDVSVSCI